MKTMFQVVKSHHSFGFDVTGVVIDEAGNVSAMKPVAREELKSGQYCPPLFTLDRHAAQNLMDELYQAGLRPSESVRRAEINHDEHVKDLRKIAFKLLDIEL